MTGLSISPSIYGSYFTLIFKFSSFMSLFKYSQKKEPEALLVNSRVAAYRAAF